MASPSEIKLSKSQNSSKISKPSPHFPGNQDQSDQFVILVSPSGTLSLMSKDDKNIFWSCELKTKVRKVDYEERELTNYKYIEVKADLDGKIDLYYKYHGSEDEKIPWKNGEDLKGYLKSKDITFGQFEEDIDLDFSSGTRLVDGHTSSEFIRIRRLACTMSMHSRGNVWRVNFSKFTGTVFGKKGMKFPCKNVHHACSDDDLVRFCEKYQCSITSAPQELLCFKNVLQQRKITKDDPLKDIGSNFVQGTYLGVAAAIKTVKNTENITNKHQKLVSTNLHNNISRFFGAEVSENGDLEFAFELHDTNLYTYLRYFPRNQSYLQDIMRGIINGLNHLHNHGLCHGNLTPWRVLLTPEGHARLCGVMNCQPFSEELKRADFQALAKLLGYSWTDDKSRVTIPTEEIYNSYDTLKLLKSTFDAGEVEASDIGYWLMQSSQPTVLEIMSHIWLWVPTRKLDLITDLSDLILDSSSSKHARNPQLKIDIDALCILLPQPNDWSPQFPTELVTEMKKRMAAIKGARNMNLNTNPSLNMNRNTNRSMNMNRNTNRSMNAHACPYQPLNVHAYPCQPMNMNSYTNQHMNMHAFPYQPMNMNSYTNQPMNTNPTTNPSTNKNPTTNPPVTYDFDKVSDLLRFIRNVMSHKLAIGHDLTANDAKDCIKDDDTFNDYLHEKFPWLLTKVYNIAKNNNQARSELPKYFE